MDGNQSSAYAGISEFHFLFQPVSSSVVYTVYYFIHNKSTQMLLLLRLIQVILTDQVLWSGRHYTVVCYSTRHTDLPLIAHCMPLRYVTFAPHTADTQNIHIC